MLRLIPGAAALAVIAFASPAFAGSIPGLLNTGVDANGTVLPSGSADPYWTVSEAGGGSVASLVGNQAPGYWIGQDGKSDWVSPGDQDGGTFDYETTFTLAAAYNPALITLSGLVAVDNEITDLLINGHSVGYTLGTVGSPAFSSFEQFNMLGDYSDFFTTGVNTIDFLVYNDGGPTGLRVEWTSSIPEPASLGALGAGLLGLSLIRRRRA